MKQKILLMLALWLSIVSSLLAQTATPPTTGDGSEGNPYQIATFENLYWLSQSSSVWSMDFVQTDYIDLSPVANWPGIGNSSVPFSGVYDGRKQTISNLKINSRDSHQGLFGIIGGTGLVTNLRISNASVVTTNDYAGILAGVNQGTLHKCHVQSGSVNGANYIGGLCGANEGSIEQCSNASMVTASGNSAGGITGIVPENGGQIYATIQHCFNYSSVTATGNSAGGIIGTSLGCNMQFCYSRGGTISAASQAGGIAGFCSVNNAFSECFTVYSPIIGEGAVGSLNNVAVKNYTQMGEAATFSNWDMYGESANGTEDIWVFSSGSNPSPVFTDQLLDSRVPNLQFTSDKTGNVSLYLGCNHTRGVYIDWGDGRLGSAGTDEGRSYSQPIVNAGKTIKVYTEGITWINLYDQQLTSIDISKSPDLENLNIYNNKLTSLDLSNNSKIINVYCYNNLLTSLDVSNCPNLSYLYCNSNLIESLDIRNCAKLRTLWCQNNQIETLLFGENPLLTSVSCQRNKLKFSTLPAMLAGSTSDTYSPQSNVEVQCVNGEVDLSNEFIISAQYSDFSVFRCYDINNNQLQLGVDFFVDKGVIRFLRIPETEVYITMVNQLFNQLTLRTNSFVVDMAGTMPEPSIEFTSNRTGSISFSFSNPQYELLYIDWGSGVLTPYYYSTQNSGSINTSSYTAGQTVKFYAPNVTVFKASEKQLTSLDVTRATNLQTLDCNKNNIEVLDISNNNELKDFNCSFNRIQTLDFSNNHKLTTVDCTRNQLTSLDVSASNALTSIICPENLISALTIGDKPLLTELVCYGNELNLSTLPVPKSSWTNFKYHIQSNFDIVPNSEGAIDLSAHINLIDENGQPKPTSFSWRTTGGSVLTNGSDYFEENGVFYFLKKPASQAYCELTNYDLFPDHTFRSVNIEIEKTFEDEPVILLASDTEYFILKLTVTESTSIGIDWGDGNIVTMWAGNTEQQFSTGSYVPGTIVKIYGKKINGIDLENQNLQTTYLEISNKLDMRNIRCAGNKFSFASLPLKKASFTNYSYAPQQLMSVKAINNQVDLSAEWLVVDENGTSHYTTYTWYSSLDNSVLLEGEDYTVSDGVFSFINIKYPVAYCVMTNTAFPGLELSTSEVMIDNALISLIANNDYFDFSLATPEVGQKVYIDWGNGTVLSYFSDDTKQIQINSNLTYYKTGDVVNIYGTNIRHFWSINSVYISYLDVSKCRALELLRIPYCAISSLDVSQNSELEILDFRNSNLSEIDVSQNAKLQTLECENNKLTFETLPKVNLNYYSYSPQSNFDAPYANGIVNLSDQFLVSNANGETYPTVFYWSTESGDPLISGVDYIASNGVFYFQRIPASSVYCVLTNEAFPDLTLKSNPITIDAVGGMPGHFITFTSNNSGNIIFSAASTYNSRLYVDWGDGLVHAADLDANITEIASSSYVAGQTVKLYGDWFSYFDISGQAISSVDVSQNAFLSQFNCSNNEISALNVENNLVLSELYCSNNSLSALNLSQNTRLEKLNTSNNDLGSLNLLPNTALIELACSNNQLNSLDVSANTALTKLVCAENNLDVLSLLGNTGITYLDCHGNLLGSLNISTLASLETLNCSNNQLNNIDLSNSSKYTNLNVSNNNLQSIDISGVTYGSTVHVSNNYFHLTSLPELLLRYSLTYAPQKEYSADCTNGVVDLSSQLTAGWNNRYTVYKWYQSNGTPLVLGTDYLSSDGIFYFLNNAGGQVYCEMTNTAYPDLTLKTVLITIDEVASLPEPLFSFTAETSGELEIHAKNNHASNLFIDWGNGELLVCQVNTVNSTLSTLSYVSGATVKVYGDQPSAIVVSNQQVNTFVAGGLSKLGVMDLHGNKLSHIDLSSFVSLREVNLSNNKLATIDFSQNTNLADLACNNNLLETVVFCPGKGYNFIGLTNNKLSQLDLSAHPSINGLFVGKNKFTLENLQQPRSSFINFEYAPQDNIEVSCINGVVDLSLQLTALDVDSNPVKTVYTWYDADNNLLTPGVDYIESDGLFMFLKVPATTVYCKLANSVYPDFANDNALRTVDITIDKAIDPAFTFESELTGNLAFTIEASLAGTMSVDWGNGIFTPFNQTASATMVSTADYTANNTVKVYALGVNDLNISGQGLTSLDVSNLSTLVSLNCSQNRLVILDINSNLLLSELNCSDNSLLFSTLPQSSALQNYNYAPQTKCQATCINGVVDLSSQLSASDASGQAHATSYSWYVDGGDQLLAAYDYIEENGVFTFVKNLGATVYCIMNNDAFPDLALQTENITIDAVLEPSTIFVSEKDGAFGFYCSSQLNTDIYIDKGDGMLNKFNVYSFTPISFNGYSAGNTVKVYGETITGIVFVNTGLTALDVSKQTNLESLNCDNNNLKFNSLPIPKSSYNTYTFASQGKMDVACLGGIVDLSSQLNVVDENGQTHRTEYKWFLLDGTPVDQSGYYNEYDGVFHFLNIPASQVYCTMTNSAFAGLTLQTVDLTIDEYNVIRVNLEAASTEISENGGSAIITANLSSASENDIEVTLGISTLSTALSSDYALSATSIHIPAGSTSGSVTLSAIDNSTPHEDLSVVVTIESCVNAISNFNQQVSVLIKDDELMPLQIETPTLDVSKVYDGTADATVIAGVLSNIRSGESVSVSATATYNDANAGQNKTITVVYSISGFDAGRYSAPENYVMNSAEITQAPLTVTAHKQSKVYGQSNPVLTFEYDGFMNGDDANDLDEQPVAVTDIDEYSDVDYYNEYITFIGGSDNNYDLSFVDGDFEITQATLTVTAHNQSKVYGESNPVLTFEYDGFVNGDDATDLDEEPAAVTNIDEYSDADMYQDAITFTGGWDNNYGFDFVDGDFEITKATLSVVAHEQEKVYGDSNPVLTFHYEGWVNGEESIDVAPSISTTIDATSVVGYYAEVITLSGGLDNNYTFDFVPGDIEITQAPLTVTAHNQSKKYGQSNPVLTFEYDGFMNGDDANDLDEQPVAVTDIDEYSEVDYYYEAITFSGGSDNNYDLSFVDGDFEITQATLTVTAHNQSKVYGESNPVLTFEYDGFVNGDDATDLDEEPAAVTNIDEYSDADMYQDAITFTGGWDNNYGFDFVDGDFEITKATLSVVAHEQEKVYGDSNPVLTFHYEGWVNGEESIDVAPSISTTIDATSVVGYYAEVITLSGGLDNNYTFDFVPGDIEITQAPLTVTAHNQSKKYGQSNPVLTFEYDGFMNGDDANDLDEQPVAVTDIDEYSEVDYYYEAITFSGGSDNNYDLSFVDGDFEITQATLTVTAHNQSKVYGESNPVLTFEYDGFVNGDDATDLDEEPAALTNIDEYSDADMYQDAITFTGGWDNNYAFDFVDGDFEITKATLTVVADDQTKVYGESNPVLTLDYIGLSTSTMPTILT
jgi:Leucine-rich repeat (LRR) protein